MNTFALQTSELLDTPRLRLLPVRSAAASGSPAPKARNVGNKCPELRLPGGPTPELQPVLIAGGDPAGRAAVLRDLAKTMPPDTVFAEADAFWEVLVQASTSSMVILSGELDELPAESLMKMLAHRHPALPVVSLDGPAPHGDVHACV